MNAAVVDLSENPCHTPPLRLLHDTSGPLLHENPRI